jgi:predicted permease
MNRLRTFPRRLRALFTRRRLDRELDEEISAHLEMQAEEFERQGMSREEARYAALRKFGGVAQVKEAYRERRGLPALETTVQDLRYGLRVLGRTPGFTAMAVLSLALGIGANTALFSVVDAVLLKKLPVREPERLVLFEWQAGLAFKMIGMSGTSYVPGTQDTQAFSLFRQDIFEKMRKATAQAPDSPLSDLFAFAPISEVVADDQAEVVNGQAVSGNYYSGLGVQPALGRAITDEDDKPGAAPVVVLSHQFWEERFGANPAAVGQTLKLNKQSFTIIGVTPPSFTGTLQVGYYPAVTVPIACEPLQLGEKSRMMPKADKPRPWWLNLMGRLKPGATYEQARESLNGTFQAAALEVMPTPVKENGPAQLNPKDYPRLIAESGSRGMLDTRRWYSSTIYILFAVVALVLLVACANVANLLLARAALRGPEISLRMAIGAGRRRLIRQLLTESVLLSLLGGAVGVLFAFWSKGALTALTDRETRFLPSGVDLSLNWRVLAFTAAVSLVTGLLFGSAPAWRATDQDLATALKQSRRATGAVSRLSKGLVVAQVALSLLLVVGAGLFIRTLYNLRHVNLGFNQENLLVFSLQPELGGYKGERLTQFYEQLFARLDNLPSVRAATFGSVPLIAQSMWNADILLPGETEKTASMHLTNRQAVRENYFATLEIPLLRGRGFVAQDDARAPKVAVVNQAFGRKFFPGEDVLGKRVTDAETKREVEIVGVVADTKYTSQRDEIEPLLYTPWRQEDSGIGRMYFVLRTAGEPTALAAAVRQAVRELDSSLPVTEVGTQTARSEATLGRVHLFARLLTFFGVLALVLAVVGLSGVLAYSVAQRTNEIGIRMALGADTRSVLRMVIRQGMKLVLLGLLMGAAGGYALKLLAASRYAGPDSWQGQLGGQLYGVSATDPLTFGAIALLLTIVALVACYVPARRAAKVDPMAALRYE